MKMFNKRMISYTFTIDNHFTRITKHLLQLESFSDCE